MTITMLSHKILQDNDPRKLGKSCCCHCRRFCSIYGEATIEVREESQSIRIIDFNFCADCYPLVHLPDVPIMVTCRSCETSWNCRKNPLRCPKCHKSDCKDLKFLDEDLKIGNPVKYVINSEEDWKEYQKGLELAFQVRDGKIQEVTENLNQKKQEIEILKETIKIRGATIQSQFDQMECLRNNLKESQIEKDLRLANQVKWSEKLAGQITELHCLLSQKSALLDSTIETKLALEKRVEDLEIELKSDLTDVPVLEVEPRDEKKNLFSRVASLFLP